MNGPSYWSWQGTMVELEIYDDSSEWDVSSLVPEHPTGIVPADEVHILVRPLQSRASGWWATPEALAEFATPVSPGALERTAEWDAGVHEP